MRRFVLLLLLIVGVGGVAHAADDPLAALAQSLAEVRKTHGANIQRDAGPELTAVKQRLREWVEGFLPPEKTPQGIMVLPSPVDLKALSAQLSKTLADKGLTCGEGATGFRCAGGPAEDEDGRGAVGDVKMSTADDGRYLVVTTSVGIRCGDDESVYIYRREPDHKWKLLFQSEQDSYGEKEYHPQVILSVDVSPARVPFDQPAPPPLVLTLGENPWCQSNWQALYTRLWRTSETTSRPKPLLDRDDILYIGDYEVASSRLTPNDALVEFKGQSIDGDVLVRSHVLHYQILDGDRIKRVAPVALSPNDFAEEWLASPWSEAATWLDSKAKGSITAKTHARLSASFGEFDSPATQCRADPTLWEVSFSAANEHSKAYALLPPNHFLVRWMAPYRFTLVDVSRKRFPGCDQKVSTPDDLGTLFPFTEGKEQ